MKILDILDYNGEGKPDRQCGGCTACCTTMGVGEIQKPAFQKCKHACAQGCAIYEDRPESCATWACLWRRGLVMPEELRPDKLGIVFDLSIDDNNVFGQTCIHAMEFRPGAMNEPAAMEVLETIGRRLPVVVRTEGSYVIIAPPHLRARAYHALANHGFVPARELQRKENS
jgi:uncharacterized protein